VSRVLGGARGSYIDDSVSSCDDGYAFVSGIECSFYNNIATTQKYIIMWVRLYR
jgi:hypothetical protein